MKTSTTIKIIIISFFVVMSQFSFGQTNTDDKKVDTKESNSTELVGSKRGILPVMTVNTTTKTYLV